MRRPVVAVLVTAGVGLTALLGWHVLHSEAQTVAGGAPVAPPTPETSGLPIAQVVLYSSGVGYFQREGEIEGNRRVDLTFAVHDVNDLLKSMVVQDQGGGHIAAVSCDGQAPIDKTLHSFAVDLTNNPSFAEILHQVRGEKVEVFLNGSGSGQSGSVTGVVVGVEPSAPTAPATSCKPPLPTPAGVEVQVASKPSWNAADTAPGISVNLWCSEGMRTVRLSDVQRVRFLNPKLDAEVKKALETLALSHDTEKKAVSLSFTGEGKRAVKVGYVVENPIWKTSYRLVLDKKGKPYLQGWAVVENTQDEDWTNVRMGLISGRPISFQMDLYGPLNVQRPVVEPELFASLRPPTYQGNMQNAVPMTPVMPGMPVPCTPCTAAPVPACAPAAFPVPAIARGLVAAEQASGTATINPRQGVQSVAAAGQLGDYFHYQIEHPVTLPRQKSALLPIVNEEIEGHKVSIYNEGVHAKYPLLGLKFKNSTKLHLTQGPITVFDGSSYAGDARILDLQPKEERLISYAVDLGTEVEPGVVEPKDEVIQIKVVSGIVEVTHKISNSKTYKVKNRSETDRVLLIEHPYRSDFSLVEPKAANERARDVYRFEVKAEAGKSAVLRVVEEKEFQHTASLFNSDENTIKSLLGHEVSSVKVRKALEEVLALKAKVTAATAAMNHAQRRLNDIREDQARIRENLKTVPPESAAYKRYVKKFDTQESEVEELTESIKGLQDRELAERQNFEKHIGNITIE